MNRAIPAITHVALLWMLVIFMGVAVPWMTDPLFAHEYRLPAPTARLLDLHRFFGGNALFFALTGVACGYLEYRLTQKALPFLWWRAFSPY
jgi:type II secretory pathway component PulF